MKNICFILSVVFSFTTININAQQPRDTYSPTVFHPTPNVSNLNGFIDYPVDLSTGGVNISIPIYTIEQGDIKVPISIDYNVNNITVNGTSSNVGLGWSLNAGGAVSRTTRGIADETASIGFMNTQDKLHTIYNGTKTGLELGLLEREARTNWLDFQADNFYFSGPFGGGKFVYDQITNKFIQIPLSSKKLEYSIASGMISEWSITDDIGTRYYYGLNDKAKERMMFPQFYGTSIPENVNNPPHYTSWYLSKIEDSKGNVVNFEYDYVQTIETGLPLIKNISQGISAKSTTHSSNAQFSTYQHREVYLKKITFNGGYVLFNLSTQDRLDLEKSKSLSEIKVFDNKNAIVKSFRLNQDYFESDVSYGGITSDWYGIPASNFTKRLKLNYIEELAADNTPPKKYSFEYNARNLSPKFSTAQDFWGRFNCKRNTSLIYRTNINGNPMGDADRTVSDECILASTLTKIWFPTGAETSYLFEPNDASSFDYVSTRIKHFVEEDVNIQISKNNCTYNLLWPNFVCEFSIPEIPNSPGAYLVSNNFWIDCPEDNGVPPGSNEMGMCNYTILGIFDSNGVKVNNITHLNTGTYTARYNYAGQLPINQSSFYHNLKYKLMGSNDVSKSDGIRIKEISTKDQNILASKKTYGYSLEDGTSSGHTFFPTFFLTPPTIPVTYSADIHNGVGSSGTRYKSVKESTFDVIEGNTHVKTYKFYGHANENVYNPNIYIEFPPPPPFPEIPQTGIHYSVADNSFLKNNLLEMNMHKDGNPNYTEKTTYDLNYHNNVRYSFPGEMFCVSIPHRMFIENIEYYSCLFHYNYTSYYRPFSKETTEKLGNSAIVNTTDYKYYNNPFLVSETSTTNSLGDSLKTEYKYPQDLTSNYQQSTLMQDMVNRNMLSRPVITKTYNGNIVTSEERTLYKKVGGFILPEFIYAKKGEMGSIVSSEDRKIKYDAYDDKGNLLQYTLENGTPVSIIWGYNGQYPIVKIEGVAYGDISNSFIDDLKNKSNADTDHCTGVSTECKEAELRKRLNEFRTNNLFIIKPAMITAYTYNPLIGVTSVIQPNGQVEYYEYDAVGRLKEVKDQDGNVLKKVDYHYQNQP